MRGGARWVRWSPQLTSMRGVLLSYVCSHHLHVTWDMQPCTPRSSRSMSPHSTVSRMFVPARPTCDDLVFLNRS